MIYTLSQHSVNNQCLKEYNKLGINYAGRIGKSSLKLPSKLITLRKPNREPCPIGDDLVSTLLWPNKPLNFKGPKDFTKTRFPINHSLIGVKFNTKSYYNIMGVLLLRRKNLAFINLRTIISTLLKALHVILFAVLNNKRIFFVGDPRPLVQEHYHCLLKAFISGQSKAFRSKMNRNLPPLSICLSKLKDLTLPFFLPPKLCQKAKVAAKKTQYNDFAQKNELLFGSPRPVDGETFLNNLRVLISKEAANLPRDGGAHFLKVNLISPSMTKLAELDLRKKKLSLGPYRQSHLSKANASKKDAVKTKQEGLIHGVLPSFYTKTQVGVEDFAPKDKIPGPSYKLSIDHLPDRLTSSLERPLFDRLTKGVCKAAIRNGQWTAILPQATNCWIGGFFSNSLAAYKQKLNFSDGLSLIMNYEAGVVASPSETGTGMIDRQQPRLLAVDDKASSCFAGLNPKSKDESPSSTFKSPPELSISPNLDQKSYNGDFKSSKLFFARSMFVNAENLVTLPTDQADFNIGKAKGRLNNTLCTPVTKKTPFAEKPPVKMITVQDYRSKSGAQNKQNSWKVYKVNSIIPSFAGPIPCINARLASSILGGKNGYDDVRRHQNRDQFASRSWPSSGTSWGLTKSSIITRPRFLVLGLKSQPYPFHRKNSAGENTKLCRRGLDAKPKEKLNFIKKVPVKLSQKSFLQKLNLVKLPSNNIKKNKVVGGYTRTLGRLKSTLYFNKHLNDKVSPRIPRFKNLDFNVSRLKSSLGQHKKILKHISSSTAAQFASNPWLKEADFVFFTNPEKSLALLSQVNRLRIPTLGILNSGSYLAFPFRSVKKASLSSNLSLTYPIMGNAYSLNFLRMVLGKLLCVLNRAS